MNDEALKEYYNRRARVYEKIYEKPERQEDLANLSLELQKILNGHDVLEIACGTGYWTERAKTAASILGTDQSAEVLEIAQEKNLPNARFMQEDAYSLSKVSGKFTAGFAGFWWSHIPRAKIKSFLDVFHSKLEHGATVVFIDNHYVEGSNHPITRTDDGGNTYQTRKLPDGSEHEVLKNFPSDQEFKDILKGIATDINIKRLSYYWIVDYKYASDASH